MKKYSTVIGPGEDEQIIERSRFITHVQPVESREEAEAFFEGLRKQYRDATHNVPAMVIGESMQIQWGSDDGEPQGTSGAPIVQMMVSEGITNVAVMVTRYFGGIKLGTGGLVRAYTSSAKLGLMAAGICDVEDRTVLTCKIDYKGFNKVQSHTFQIQEGQSSQCVQNIEYLDAVTFDFVCRPEEVEAAKMELDGLTAGQIQITSEQNKSVMIPREE